MPTKDGVTEVRFPVITKEELCDMLDIVRLYGSGALDDEVAKRMHLSTRVIGRKKRLLRELGVELEYNAFEWRYNVPRGAERRINDIIDGRANGLPFRVVDDAPRYRGKLTDEERERVLGAYERFDGSATATARKFGYDVNTVLRCWRRAKLKIRPYGHSGKFLEEVQEGSPSAVQI